MIAIFPEIVSCVASGDLERLSVLVRRYFVKADAQKPCVDMRTAISNLGVAIQSLRYPEYGSLLARDDKGQFTVTMVLSETALAPQHERFLLAHMLGHYMLHIQPKIAQGEFSISGFKEAVAPWERYATLESTSKLRAAELREVEADQFAAALLMPRAMVLKAQAKLQAIDKLAEFFGVDEAVMAARLEQLNAPVKAAKADPAAATTSKKKRSGKIAADDAPKATGRGMDRIRQIAKLMDRAK